jgi:transposase-like protein
MIRSPRSIPLASLATLHRALRHATGTECPECRSESTECNGGRGEYRCVECDHRWGDDGSGHYGF